MIKPLYIHGSGCITIQPTFEKDFFFEDIRHYSGSSVPAADPNYKSLIPPIQLRRMGKSMKMALYTAYTALEQADITTVDAIITGTGLGCLKDSERFVENIRDNQEQFLNPTPFIQSTHNMAAGALALSLGCRGYNMTYVNDACSFESALLDSMLYTGEHPDHTILLGGVEELGTHTLKLWDLTGCLKNVQHVIPTSLHTNELSAGKIATEGATFFVVSGKATTPHLGIITDMATPSETTDMAAIIPAWLLRRGLSPGDIDVVITGRNGDAGSDPLYDSVGAVFPQTPQLAYKHVLGTYDTVNAAAVHIALLLLRRQHIPDILRINYVPQRTIKKILICNRPHTGSHSLILIEHEF